MPKEVLARWEKELSNWGRWGRDDEIGTLNLVTPEKRKRAAALVMEGFSVSLASDWNTTQEIDNPRPVVVDRQSLTSDTLNNVSYHGWAVTHLDALAHQYNDAGQGYNGYTPAEDVVRKQGHSKNSIRTVKNGIFTRGILMDIPRLKGVPYLELGTPIYSEDLEAWEKMTGLKVQPGDALIVRVGRWAARKTIGPFRPGSAWVAAGLHPSVLPWLKQRDVAVLVGEAGQSLGPSDGEIHDIAIHTLGIHVIDAANLEALAEAAAQRNRWEFLFTVAPLPIPGSTGSPVNPVATF
jgi:kynurenine formamidase